MIEDILFAGCSLRLIAPPPLVVPAVAGPVPLVGSARATTFLAAPYCLEGDELPPSLRGPLEYTAPPFTISGVGRLSLLLRDAHWSPTAAFEGRRLLRCGPRFQARFEVIAPAMQPSPTGPVPDPVPLRVLDGRFVPARSSVTAG